MSSVGPRLPLATGLGGLERMRGAEQTWAVWVGLELKPGAREVQCNWPRTQ